MKKLLLVLAALFLVSGSVFADEADEVLEKMAEEESYDDQKAKTVKIVPENQHVTDSHAKVEMLYSPMYDEIRIDYTTNYLTYDEGEAMNTVLAVLQDFQKERGYTSYRYLQTPRRRYYVDKNSKPKQKYAVYSCHVQMVKGSNIKALSGGAKTEEAASTEE